MLTGIVLLCRLFQTELISVVCNFRYGRWVRSQKVTQDFVLYGQTAGQSDLRRVLFHCVLYGQTAGQSDVLCVSFHCVLYGQTAGQSDLLRVSFRCVLYGQNAGQSDLLRVSFHCCRKIYGLLMLERISGFTSVHLWPRPGTVTVWGTSKTHHTNGSNTASKHVANFL